MSCCTCNAIVTSLVGRNVIFIANEIGLYLSSMTSVKLFTALSQRATFYFFHFFVPISLSLGFCLSFSLPFSHAFFTNANFIPLTLIRCPILKYVSFYMQKYFISCTLGLLRRIAFYQLHTPSPFFAPFLAYSRFI